MHRGYICIYRKINKTSFYKDSYAVHIAITLLLRSNHKDGEVFFHGEKIKIARGQCVIGRESLWKETGIKLSTIRNKIEVLKKAGFLTIESNYRHSVITICNYNTYQFSENEEKFRTGEWTGESENLGQVKKNDLGQVKQRRETQVNRTGEIEANRTGELTSNSHDLGQVYINTTMINNNVKNNNNKNNGHFGELWEKYPNKIGKAEAERYFKHSVKTEQDLTDINKALMNYLNSGRVSKGFIQNGSKWFRNWKDWIAFNEPAGPEHKAETATDKQQISNMIFKELGRIATREMIKNTMLKIPEKHWWMVNSFLQKTYEGINRFPEVEKELIAERRNNLQQLETLTAGIGN